MDTNFEDDFEIVEDIYAGEDFYDAEILSATDENNHTQNFSLSESVNNENFFSATDTNINDTSAADIDAEEDEEEKEYKQNQVQVKKHKKKKKIKKKKTKSKSKTTPTTINNNTNTNNNNNSNTNKIESNYNLISNTNNNNNNTQLQLHQEFEQELIFIKKLKLRMEKKCIKYESLVNENLELNKSLKHSLKCLAKERSEICKTRKTFMNDCKLLSNILVSLDLKPAQTAIDDECNSLVSNTSSDVSTGINSNSNSSNDVFHIHENRELLMSLRLYFNECKSMTNEVKRIKVMREQQQQLINECKIGLQTMHTAHVDNCLISLDKSKTYECKECGVDIALCEDIESKCYQVGQGSFSEKKRGYLFSNAVNLVFGTEKTENFTTGAYQISWVSCLKCQSKIGWKYISADNNTNNTKVGKYCLARYSLSSPEDRIQQT